MQLYTLKNRRGITLKVSSYGTIITELHVPDRAGQLADIVLGYDSIEQYKKATPYFGATVGRVANRIKNAEFTLEGTRYQLADNDRPHCLHGGIRGWDKVEWNAELTETPSGPEIRFTYSSPDGEEGFPGNVDATVVYRLTHDDELIVQMEATTDRTTPVNMVHHTYWNLGGHASGSIADHLLTLSADQYTPCAPVEGGEPVPDGTVAAVAGTPFDFRAPKAMGKDLAAAGGLPAGFDHNWVVRGEPRRLRPAARVEHPGSGRILTVEADQPGIQFYSGKFLDGSLRGKGGHAYQQYGGFCLETQSFPNAINVPAWKDQVILKPGQRYQHTMVHRFTAE